MQDRCIRSGRNMGITLKIPLARSMAPKRESRPACQLSIKSLECRLFCNAVISRLVCITDSPLVRPTTPPADSGPFRRWTKTSLNEKHWTMCFVSPEMKHTQTDRAKGTRDLTETYNLSAALTRPWPPAQPDLSQCVSRSSMPAHARQKPLQTKPPQA